MHQDEILELQAHTPQNADLQETLLPALPAASGEAALVPAAARRLPTLRMQDPRQRRAGRNLLAFFALMLIFTLVARGTAGATLPRVETARPQKGDIVQKVNGTATIKAGGGISQPVPAGLTVKKLLAEVGQPLAEGDAIALFDMDELREQLLRQQAALAELDLKLTQLQRGTPYDGGSLTDAQRRLARAQQDANNAKTAGEAEIAAAKQALTAAEEAAAQALAHLNSITDPDSQEYKDAKADLDTKNADSAAKKATLQQTESQEASQNQISTRAVEDAQSALVAAQTADTEARRQAGDTAAQNKIQASTLTLDRAAQQKKVDALQALLDTDGQLLTDIAGTVEALPTTGEVTGEESPFRLTDDSSGHQAELWLDKADAEKLAAGDSCQVAATGGNMYYRPTVDGVVTAVGTPGKDGRVKVTISLPAGEWKGGQSVEVQLVQDKQTHNLCLPLSALHVTSTGYYVLVLQQQSTVLGQALVATQVPVTVKAQDDQMAAVEGPLSDREDVVTNSSKPVEPGDKVRRNAT